MQVKRNFIFIRVFFFSVLLLLVYVIAFSVAYETAYKKEDTSFREWMSWVDTMTQKVHARYDLTSPSETILRETDVPIFLVNSRCFVILASMSLDKRRKLLSLKDQSDFEFFLGVRNRYIETFLKNSGYNDEDITRN